VIRLVEMTRMLTSEITVVDVFFMVFMVLFVSYVPLYNYCSLFI
jgi:hypothetical protein